MSAYVINSKVVCMTQEMRKDRETVTTQGEVTATTNRTLDTMDEVAYRELKNEKNKIKERSEQLEKSLSIALDINDKYQRENKKLMDRAHAAEGENTIIKGIGNTSPEMKALQSENKTLKKLHEDSLGEYVDKITVLQLRCDRYEQMRLAVLKSLGEMKDILHESERKNK